MGRLRIQHTGLTGEDEEAIIQHFIAGGTQAVAVYHRPCAQAIAEADRCGSIPRSHEAGMVVIEATQVFTDEVPRAEGLRDEHHHAVRQAASTGHQQFQYVVEACGVTLPRRNHGENRLDVLPEERALQITLKGSELVEVTAQGVHFPIVRQVAEGVGERPAREGVGGITLVDNSHAALKALIGKVGVELRQLRAEKQPLVDDGSSREG